MQGGRAEAEAEAVCWFVFSPAQITVSASVVEREYSERAVVEIVVMVGRSKERQRAILESSMVNLLH